METQFAVVTEGSYLVRVFSKPTSKLPGHMAGIHSQIRPCHKGARIRKQEYSCSSVFLRLTQPPKHILCRPICPPFGIPLEQLFDHRSHNISWRNSVDPDSVFAPLRSQVLCQLHYASFGGIVCRTDQALMNHQLDLHLGQPSKCYSRLTRLAA